MMRAPPSQDHFETNFFGRFFVWKWRMVEFLFAKLEFYCSKLIKGRTQ
jgi:hypothetical protein